MKESYDNYQEFLIDLIKETNKVISLVPKDNDVSQYHYDIVYTLHQLREIYHQNKKLKQKLEDIEKEKSGLVLKLKFCENNRDFYIEENSKLKKGKK